MRWPYRLPGSRNQSVALLIVRLVMGTAFILHGWPKIQAPMSWMGPDTSTPEVLQLLAALSEFGGGIALLAGFLTPLASLGLLGTMAYATWFHIGRGDPFVGRGTSYEPALLYAALALLFLLIGPGQYSVDAQIARRANSA